MTYLHNSIAKAGKKLKQLQQEGTAADKMAVSVQLEEFVQKLNSLKETLSGSRPGVR